MLKLSSAKFGIVAGASIIGSCIIASTVAAPSYAMMRRPASKSATPQGQAAPAAAAPAAAAAAPQTNPEPYSELSQFRLEQFKKVQSLLPADDTWMSLADLKPYPHVASYVENSLTLDELQPIVSGRFSDVKFKAKRLREILDGAIDPQRLDISKLSRLEFDETKDADSIDIRKIATPVSTNSRPPTPVLRQDAPAAHPPAAAVEAVVQQELYEAFMTAADLSFYGGNGATT